MYEVYRAVVCGSWERGLDGRNSRASSTLMCGPFNKGQILAILGAQDAGGPPLQLRTTLYEDAVGTTARSYPLLIGKPCSASHAAVERKENVSGEEDV